MLKIAVRGILAKKLRVAATGLAVLLGVAFMGGTLVMTDTIGATFDDLFETVNEGTDAVVRSASEADAGFGASRARVDEGLLSIIESVPGVADAEGGIQGYAQIVGRDGEPVGNPSNGPPTFGFSWSEVERLNPYQIDEGRSPERPGEVVIDRAAADEGGLEVGDVTTVLTFSPPAEVTIVGIATFGGQDSAGGASAVLFTLEQAQELAAEPGKFDAIAVAGSEGVDQEELAAQLRDELPDDVEVLTGDAITEENQQQVGEFLTFFNAFLITFAGIALFVGSFIINNTFSITVAQRTRELALLRALGASRSQVTASVLLEAFVVGAIASGIGLGLGVALAGGLRSLLVAFGLDFPSSGTVVKSTSLLIAGSAGMAVTMISAILPARRAARVAPVAALTESEIDSSATSGRRTVAGIVITGLAFASIVTGVFTEVGNGLQLVGLGMPLAFVGVAVLGPVLARPVLNVLGAPLPRLRGTTGALAQRNALRNPRRTAATAAALTIGVGLVGLITIMADSTKASIGQIVDEVFQGDFVVLTDAFDFAGGLPIELADELRALPESDQVVVVRGTVAELEGSAGFVPGVDTVNADGLLDPGIIEGSWEALGPGTIALHHEEAASLGVGIGDHVTLRFVDTGDQQLAVAMIYEDETILEEQFVPLTVFEANVVDQRDIQLLVNVAPGIDPDVAREALVGVTERYPNAMVQDRSEFKEVFASQINQLLALVFVMLALAIVIAIIGIANTLALSILERTRELGVLRAVGMTRSQLRSAVRYESVLVSLLGATLGLVLGVAFGVVLMTALRDDGLKVLSIPLGQLTLIVVVAAVCGVGASVAPARRAARLDVLDAVTAE